MFKDLFTNTDTIEDDTCWIERNCIGQIVNKKQEKQLNTENNIISNSINILDLLNKYNIVATKSEARRLVLMEIIKINNVVYNNTSDTILLDKTKLLIIHKGNIEYRILHDKVEVIK